LGAFSRWHELSIDVTLERIPFSARINALKTARYAGAPRHLSLAAELRYDSLVEA
jgi:hypothetical protein